MPSTLHCLFDLDGTLVDSQDLNRRCMIETFSALGKDIDIPRDEWIQNAVHSLYTAREWLQKFNLDIDAETFRNKRNQLYLQIAQAELVVLPGAKQLLRELFEANIPIAVASGNHPVLIEHILEIMDLMPLINLYLSDSDVGHKKPAPDVFIEAAKRLQASPADCVVFEDSLIGLQSAKAAGMKCIICPDKYSELPRDRYAAADLIVPSLSVVTLAAIEQLLQ